MSSLKPSSIGRVTISPVVAELLEESTIPLGTILERHRLGDWGKIGPADRAVNNESIKDGNGVVLSMYECKSEMIFVRTQLSPFKSERGTELATGWELN
jgi:hypothetical protein